MDICPISLALQSQYGDWRHPYPGHWQWNVSPFESSEWGCFKVKHQIPANHKPAAVLEVNNNPACSSTSDESGTWKVFKETLTMLNKLKAKYTIVGQTLDDYYKRCAITQKQPIQIAVDLSWLRKNKDSLISAAKSLAEKVENFSFSLNL